MGTARALAHGGAGQPRVWPPTRAAMESVRTCPCSLHAERRRSHRGASLTLLAVNFAYVSPGLHNTGLNVLPVDPETKRPLLPWSRWQTERQSRADLDALRRAHPGAAAAVVLGGPSLALADVETDSAAGERSLRKAGLPLPPTAVFSSPRGSHRLYRTSGRLPRRVGALPDVDLLGSGYVIVPPSAGRSWVLDLAHLQDLPPEWAEVACRRQCRRGARAPEPPPSSLQVTPSAASRSYDLLAAETHPDFLPAVGRVLGVPTAGVGVAFRCILHAERRPSAALWRRQDGTVHYQDFHTGRTLTLAEVFAARVTGKVRLLRGPELAVWKLRLLVAAGLVTPAVVNAPPLPVGVPRAVQRVYRGFLELLACRWVYTPGAPAPFTWRFAARWCRVNERTAAAALRDLLRRGILMKTGTWGRTALFLPAKLDSDRGAS
jgi:hypothetical protein